MVPLRAWNGRLNTNGLDHRFNCIPDSHLNWLIMNIQAEVDPLMERSHRFPRAVDVNVFFGSHKALFMVNASLDHTITDRLEEKMKC